MNILSQILNFETNNFLEIGIISHIKNYFYSYLLVNMNRCTNDKLVH